MIVVGLDPRLGPLPFAALRHDGAYLIEGVQILSIAVCGTPCAASLEPVHDSALVVGNPAGDEAAGSSPLDHVKKEAGEIATLYPEVVTLIGNEANRQNVLRHLSERSVFHFAGHAVANGHNPALTFLTLAGENGERGRLYTYEIANMDLSTVSLVVLAGCKTAASAGPAAFPSLASAFVAAGAKNSIGTLWNTPDRVAREFSLRLHHGLRKGDRPVGAVVRDVQLAMLRSVDPELRTPGAWGAFQLIGTARETSTERSSYGPRHSLLRPDVTRSR